MKSAFCFRTLLRWAFLALVVCPSLHAAEPVPAAPMSPDGARPAVVRAETWRVVVPVSVFLPDEEAATGLAASDFRLRVDGREVKEFSFSSDSQAPFILMASWDASSKTVMRHLPWIRGVVEALAFGLSSDNQLGLSAYGAAYRVLLEPTGDRTALLERFRNLSEAVDPTATGFWSVKLESILGREMKRSAPPNRTAIAMDHGLYDLAGRNLAKKALLLFSDGDENLSHITLRHVQRYGVPVFAVCFGNGKMGWRSFTRRGAILEKVAEESGGAVLDFHDGDDPAEVGRRIARLIQNQYLLSFRPAESLRDEKSHEVEVEVARPGTRLAYRRAFRYTRD